MIKPGSSLFAKIICWFFLNLILVVTVLTVFFAFQPQVDLHSIFGQQVSSRLHSAGMLLSHDLSQTPRKNWPQVLSRHAAIHQVNFALVLEDGSHFSSMEEDLPEVVKKRAVQALRLRPDQRGPHDAVNDFQKHREARDIDYSARNPDKRVAENRPPKPPRPPNAYNKSTHLMMRTQHPTLYWNGIDIPPLFAEPSRPPAPAILLAVSNSITGNGFFFDPFPWMFVVGLVILISVSLWIPMVKNITGPLLRMTLAAEEIAKGSFDVPIHEPRNDEIGRLARAINHMTSRLSALVKGQKRFLGDVAHELGSPIARIQFGLGALQQRVQEENKKRVNDVMEDVDQMSKLVNELLSFSRADTSKETVQLKTIYLLPVVQAAVKREMTPAAEIITHIDHQIRVVASADLLTRAIGNLIRNAVKYAGDAGPIYVLAERKNDTLELEVRDSGPGVSDDLLDQLFEPFFRPEPSRDRDSGGVGLGLAIVKTCIDGCNATVSARNIKPKGFAVTVTFLLG